MSCCNGCSDENNSVASCKPCAPRKPCAGKKYCKSNYTKISAILMNGLAGKGMFPPGLFLNGFYYLDLCTGLAYISNNREKCGWKEMPPILECTHYYFNDTTNKVIWKVSRKKDSVSGKVVTAVYAVNNIASEFCNNDIFVDSNTRTWYVMEGGKWAEKLGRRSNNK